LLVLLVLAVSGSWIGRLHVGGRIAAAAIRAVVQLAAVSVVIAAVLGNLAWSAVFAMFMFGVAVFTSSSRIGSRRAWPWVAVSVGAGVIPVLTVIFLSGAVPLNGPSLVPMAGIIIGGAMTANSLTGRRVFAALRDEHGLYEAALSIGLRRQDAISEVAGRHLPEALVPGLDQTRTVGLVTLPGAFVGVLLGGARPVQAGLTQLLVLIGLLAVEATAVLVTVELIASGRIRAAPAGDPRPRPRRRPR
jgi:putative ABC transport system permease protein